MRIILASASPRRRKLMSRVVKDFEVVPATGEETADPTLPPEQFVCRLAENKCNEVFSKCGGVVVGCDTIVVYDGKTLGKPKDREDAVATLKALSGKTHCVYTGVCVRSSAKTAIAYGKTEVTFFRLSDDFIEKYVDGGSPMDKAGSYGIQDGGVVRRFRGSYTNVVGFPVRLVKKLLKEVLGDETTGN